MEKLEQLQLLKKLMDEGVITKEEFDNKMFAILGDSGKQSEEEEDQAEQDERQSEEEEYQAEQDEQQSEEEEYQVEQDEQRSEEEESQAEEYGRQFGEEEKYLEEESDLSDEKEKPANESNMDQAEEDKYKKTRKILIIVGTIFIITLFVLGLLAGELRGSQKSKMCNVDSLHFELPSGYMINENYKRDHANFYQREDSDGIEVMHCYDDSGLLNLFRGYNDMVGVSDGKQSGQEERKLRNGVKVYIYSIGWYHYILIKDKENADCYYQINIYDELTDKEFDKFIDSIII